jgi:selenocysteine lyase/cysteine desulfurase
MLATTTITRFPPLVGQGRRVRTILGKSVEYLDADSAATTRPLEVVRDKVLEFLGRYGSVHRGSGANSRWSTEIFAAARQALLEFVDADPRDALLCVTSNTTAAINKLRRKLDLRAENGDTVVLSEFEHSSNDLPWRGCRPVRIPAGDDGLLDLNSLEDCLRGTGHPRRGSAAGRRQDGGRLLVAVTGASNLTGALTPIRDIARITHRHGGMVFVDAAQLAGHRAISMRGQGDGDHLDFLAFPGHKMYAPFGAGVLIGDARLLSATPPDEIGGGTVEFVTTERFDLAPEAFRRENSGTPNAVGIVAMAVAAQVLKSSVGFAAIERHEQDLLDAARLRLPRPAGLRVLGELDYSARRKCAVLSFALEGHPHALLAARLSHEFGIGVRHGHLCQFAYVARLLGLSATEVAAIREEVLSGRREAMYGVVRASFGISNGADDVQRIGDALEEIAATPERKELYERTPAGEWLPKGLPRIDAAEFFVT